MLKRLENYRKLFESHLDEWFAKNDYSIEPVAQALKYGIKNGGKRIRPTLCYMAAEFCGKSADYVSNLAIGMEMIHSYSLIHDDLPCMDDDDLRRGKPTVHKIFGDGIAVLAGDALLNMAFEVFLSDKNFDENSLKAYRYIAENSGANGMIGGQSIDLSNVSGANLDLEEIKRLNRLKTSCLLKSALVGSCIKCGGNESEIRNFENFAQKLGEIFQIVDDILDKTSNEEILGKQVMQDESKGKTTFVDAMGIDGARDYIAALEKSAIADISKFGDRARPLIELCRYLTMRIY